MPDENINSNPNINNTNASDITEAEIIDEAKLKQDRLEAERQRINDNINLSTSGSLNISKQDLQDALALQYKAVPEEQKIKNLTATLEPIFEEYKEKYGIDFKLDTFKNTIEFIVKASDEKKELYRLVNESIVVSLIEVTIIKAILTLSYVINNQLVNLQAPDLNNEWSVNTIMTVEKVFQWIEKLNELRERYKSFNIEARIKRASEKMLQKEAQEKSGDQSLPGFNEGDDPSKIRLIDLLQQSLKEDDQIGGITQ